MGTGFAGSNKKWSDFPRAAGGVGVSAPDPPEVVEELFRGVQEREGEVAVNFAAMLLFINGKAEEPFDWSQRPFLLRFNTDDPDERREAFL